MADSYWLVPVQGGYSSVVHYTSASQPGDSRSVYLGSTSQDVKTYLNTGLGRLKQYGITKVNKDILNEQGPPTALDTIGVGAAFLAPGISLVDPAVITGLLGGAISKIKGKTPKPPSPSNLTKDVTAAATTSAVIAALFDPKLVVRVLEIITGVFLIFMGLKAMTGVGPDITIPGTKVKA